jgi:hypothetical protein
LIELRTRNKRTERFTRLDVDQEFDSLDAQYDASDAYIRSQADAGWTLIKMRYEDGGFSGGSTDRPALQKLLGGVRTRKINAIFVYEVDRLQPANFQRLSRSTASGLPPTISARMPFSRLEEPGSVARHQEIESQPQPRAKGAAQK